MQVLERRVAAAEGRLAGVTNLAGRLMALDQVAEELGVDVPSMQVCVQCIRHQAQPKV